MCLYPCSAYNISLVVSEQDTLGYCLDYDDDVQDWIQLCVALQFASNLLFPVCYDGALRLVDGNASGEGRVEICFSNTYGNICADFWDEVEAQIVCGQLGFMRNGQSSVYNAYVART